MTVSLSVLGPFAQRQHGLVTAEQFRSVGWSERQVKWTVKRGLIVSIRPRVWRVVSAPVSWEQCILAAALSAGNESRVSFTTSSALLMLRHSNRDGAGIHLSGTRRTRLSGITFHFAELTEDETTTRGAIPLTTAERTIIDLASDGKSLPGPQLGECVDDALRRQLIDLARLRDLVDKLSEREHPRLGRIRAVLAARISGYKPDESKFETRMNQLWEQLGLPPATRQHTVRLQGPTYRLDRALVEEKIAIEWDSDRFHTYPSDRDYDSNRRARLVAAGWLVIGVTAQTSPRLLAEAVQRAVHDRAVGGGDQIPEQAMSNQDIRMSRFAT